MKIDVYDAEKWARAPGFEENFPIGENCTLAHVGTERTDDGKRAHIRRMTCVADAELWHHFAVLNTCTVAGIASGKTTIVTASNLIDCLTTPYFRALNTSVTAKQAELAFDMAMSWIEGNGRIEHLIQGVSLRPYPAISFANFSEYEFRTAGSNAKFIRGSEYDRINFDECGQVPTAKIAEVLRHRLRGTRPDGDGSTVPRLCRLDTVTSATAAPWLKERYQKARDRKLYFSMKTATWDNTYLPPEQIEAMWREMVLRFLRKGR